MLILHPHVAIVWTGAVHSAARMVEQLRFYIEDYGPNHQSILKFLNSHSGVDYPDLEYSVVVKERDRIVHIDVSANPMLHHRRIPGLGVATTNGSGSEILVRELVSQMGLQAIVSGDALTLAVAAAASVLNAEYERGEASAARFGGAFEFAYVTPAGFKKADNVMFANISLKFDSSHPREMVDLGVSDIIHTAYEGDTLLVSSISPFDQGGRTLPHIQYHAVHPPSRFLGSGRVANRGTDWLPEILCLNVRITDVSRGFRVVRQLIRGSQSPLVKVIHRPDGTAPKVEFDDPQIGKLIREMIEEPSALGGHE